MKNKFIIFYTIFASAVFAFAISLFGVNIYKEYSQGQSRANQRYNTLVTDIKSYNSIDKEISENSLSNIKSVLKDFNDFSFIQINLNNSEILKYPKDASADLTVSNLTKTFSSNFNTQNGQFEILCNMYLLRPSSIYYYAKISFIIILIVTIITIILIFYINSQEKQFSAKVSSEADSELLSENDFDSKLELDENLSDSSSEVNSSFIQQNSVNSIDLDIDLSSESEQNKNSFDEDSEQISDLENKIALEKRIKFVLDIAKENDIKTLILGAYGCGVFGQNPAEVASIFKEYLKNDFNCFDKVIFAIPKNENSKNYEKFIEVFCGDK